MQTASNATTARLALVFRWTGTDSIGPSKFRFVRVNFLSQKLVTCRWFVARQGGCCFASDGFNFFMSQTTLKIRQRGLHSWCKGCGARPSIQPVALWYCFRRFIWCSLVAAIRTRRGGGDARRSHGDKLHANLSTVRITKWNWSKTVSKQFSNCFVSVSFRCVTRFQCRFPLARSTHAKRTFHTLTPPSYTNLQWPCKFRWKSFFILLGWRYESIDSTVSDHGRTKINRSQRTKVTGSALGLMKASARCVRAVGHPR